MMEATRVFGRKVGFVFHEALLSIGRSRWMSAIVVATMIVALAVLGGFWLLFEDLTTLTQRVGSQLQIVAFLQDKAAPTAVLADVQRLPGVAQVELIGRDEAWRQLRQEMSHKAALDEVLTGNPLPDTLQIHLVAPEAAAAVVPALRAMPAIEELKFSQDLLDRLQDLTALVRTVGLTISAILGLATVAIVVNTIRLTVANRRNEIAIMQLVGASPWYIRWPFVLEGILFGLISSALAVALLVAWRFFTLHKLQATLAFLPLANDFGPVWRVAILLVPVGVLLGCFGSLISVHQFLRLNPSK